VNAITTLKGELPFPSLLPNAIVCGVVDSVKVPDAQLALGLPPPPGVALLHVNWMALNGTEGQLVNEEDDAFTVSVQLEDGLLMLQETVAVVLPLTGVVSGSGELKVMVEGETVTALVTENARFLGPRACRARAATGRFALQTAALHIVANVKPA